MEDIQKNNISQSLVNKKVYGVCLTSREGTDILNDDFAIMRKNFFDGNMKTVKVSTKDDVIKGFAGKLKGKMKKRGLSWKRTAGKTITEESFNYNGGSAIVRRDYFGTIISKIYFDKQHVWLKSEYFDSSTQSTSQIILKPVPSINCIERFDYNPSDKMYQSEILYPSTYNEGTAEQSIVNANFGIPMIIVQTEDGVFSYSPKEEALARENCLKEIADGTIVLMPAWEVKDGKLQTESSETEQESEVITNFENLESAATIKQIPEAVPESEEDIVHGEIAASDAYIETIDNETTPLEPLKEKDATPIAIINGEILESTSDLEMEHIMEMVRKAYYGEITDTEEEPSLTADNETELDENIAEEPLTDNTPLEEASEDEETLENFDGQDAELAKVNNETSVALPFTGRQRSEQANGMTAYEGEYKDGRRDGFGAYYYKDGNLCYAGSWKDDKKQGLGVSFRNSDHALHVTNWESDKSGDYVTLFDKDGILKYSGKIIDGKKQGAGMTYREDGTIFIGKWKDGDDTGFGSLFDEDGDLVYTGMWKDGKRHGTGTEFGKSGEILFSGEWKDDNQHNGILYKRSM